MKIACIGGGPAGLYFAILMKKARPTSDITVYERNPHGSTFGWGVVFSDETVRNFLAADPETSRAITDSLIHWDDIEVYYRDQCIRSSGHGFCGVGRQHLLTILEDRATALGVKLVFGQDVAAKELSPQVDLVVAADGIFSKTREQLAEYFKPDIDQRRCRYTWLGTRRHFEAFTFLFEETKWGWFQAHCYSFDKDTSTFIAECPDDIWRAAGLADASQAESISFCEKLFARYLNGAKLMSNSAHLRGSAAWITFNRVSNAHWSHENIVLLGDAAATAHFSIGSGTKLAMESAIALADTVLKEVNLKTALASYESLRRTEVLKLQSAARNSTEWFENVNLKSRLAPEQFAYSLLTRSQRIGHQNLRVRDAKYVGDYETWFAKHVAKGSTVTPRPPMFTPLQLRDLTLQNRVAVSPMAMYSAVDGRPSDFHLVHFGSLALGGAGLLFTEMTNVAADARITPGCAGLYTDDHVTAWKRIVDFVHANSPAKFALQLGHAGPKGSTRLAWDGMDLPLPENNWEIIAPSARRYLPESQLPREMTPADFKRVKEEFVAAAKRGNDAGFDMLELHCAHGYLLSSFISPLTNKRTDNYGGSLENRLRFPLEVFSALRSVWPATKPMSVRISAVDWVPGGTTIEDAVVAAQLFREAGADAIDVSTGQVSKDQKPVYGRMYQTPFADRIRAEVGIATMAVGNIFDYDHVNTIIASGRADLCLLARPHLADPHWTLRAAADQGYDPQWWPNQYSAGKRQLETNLKRARETGAI